MFLGNIILQACLFKSLSMKNFSFLFYSINSIQLIISISVFTEAVEVTRVRRTGGWLRRQAVLNRHILTHQKGEHFFTSLGLCDVSDTLTHIQIFFRNIHLKKDKTYSKMTAQFSGGGEEEGAPPLSRVFVSIIHSFFKINSSINIQNVTQLMCKHSNQKYLDNQQCNRILKTRHSGMIEDVYLVM